MAKKAIILRKNGKIIAFEVILKFRLKEGRGHLRWRSDATGWCVEDVSGWWVEDVSGWWPASQWLKIDGYWYYFNASGYMVTNQYVDGYWIGADGICR